MDQVVDIAYLPIGRYLLHKAVFQDKPHLFGMDNLFVTRDSVHQNDRPTDDCSFASQLFAFLDGFNISSGKMMWSASNCQSARKIMHLPAVSEQVIQYLEKKYYRLIGLDDDTREKRHYPFRQVQMRYWPNFQQQKSEGQDGNNVAAHSADEVDALRLIFGRTLFTGAQKKKPKYIRGTKKSAVVSVNDEDILNIVGFPTHRGVRATAAADNENGEATTGSFSQAAVKLSYNRQQHHLFVSVKHQTYTVAESIQLGLKSHISAAYEAAVRIVSVRLGVAKGHTYWYNNELWTTTGSKPDSEGKIEVRNGAGTVMWEHESVLAPPDSESESS